MNCPTCHQSVGDDQWAASRWRDCCDELGVVLDRVRDIWIVCEHCGPHRALQSAERRILSVFAPRGSRARREMYARMPHLATVPIDYVQLAEA